MTQYVSKKPDPQGIVHWTEEENAVWHDLVTRQRQCLPQRACQAYLHGLDLLDLPTHRVPQLEEINHVLRQTTGWQCTAVPALINFDRFFSLLSQRQFPVATFLRTREEFDYLQEPDFFHEIFGHCAMLTNPAFAEFTHKYGQLGLNASHEDRVYLARLYWFTVEFGLLKETQGTADTPATRIYGGGILSSPGETQYALLANDDLQADSQRTKPVHQPFDPVEIMRTPYRIDIMQPVYFVLDSIQQLYDVAQMDVMALVAEAKAKGLHKPLFEAKVKPTHAATENS
ncbi:phenylalanine 4-monooxygenase [Photobacterium japonica]|uniref:phenylalanine 4-monooxygenase n=1 Tax=Photobacterium japonica TaxID=2910235 RepID=UPI003D0DB2AE